MSGVSGPGLCVLYELAALAAASVAVRRKARRRKVRHAEVECGLGKLLMDDGGVE